MSMAKKKLICVGLITGAHGIKGDVKVKSFTEEPENLGKFGILTDKTGKKNFDIKVKHRTKEHLIVQFTSINDRNEAEALKGQNLFIFDSALPPTNDEEFYYAQLIGLKVQKMNGNEFGVVAGVQNFGAGDILEILSSNQEEFFIPFTKESVPIIDINDGFIAINPPEGLLELPIETAYNETLQ